MQMHLTRIFALAAVASLTAAPIVRGSDNPAGDGNAFPIPGPEGGPSFATLVSQTTIIDNHPAGTIGPEDGFGNPGYAISCGGDCWVDAAVLVYDFGAVTSVSNALLTLNVDQRWVDAGADPTIEMFVYADDGVIQLEDIFLGAGDVRDSYTYASSQIRIIDVTAAVNDALASSQYVGFRFTNSRDPSELPPSALEGIHYQDGPPLEFEEGGTPTQESSWGAVKSIYR